MQTSCTLYADINILYADMMQTSIQVCIWRTFWLPYAKYAQGNYADLIHTLCRLEKTLCRLNADYNTTYTSVHLTQCFVIIRRVEFADPTLEDCWYGRVALLCRIRVKLDKKDGDGSHWKVGPDGLRLHHDRVSLRLCTGQVRMH